MFINTIERLDQETKQGIDEFLLNQGMGNFFQTTKAYNFFANLSGHEPIMLVALETDKIVGVLQGVIINKPGIIKGFFTRRCIVEAGPVIEDNREDVAEALLQELNNTVSGKSIYTEFRNHFDQSGIDNAFKSTGFEYEEHLNYIVCINDFESARRNLSSSRKREINKSTKSGAEIIEAENLRQIEEFYTILSDLYANTVKKPLAGFDFFKKFYNQEGLGKYFLVKFEGSIVGGIMCPIFKDTIYEWYVCGLDREFNNISPSVMATWAPIKYAAENGLKYFDFMGAGKPDEDYGVREFKSRFGGELVNYGRYKRINSPILYKIGELGVKLLYR